MQHKGLVILAVLAVLAVSAVGNVLAEEVIHFTNGATLAIRGHVVEQTEAGAMIKVDLGDDKFMAFPQSVVDKIEVAPEGVTLMPSTRSNQIIEPTGDTRVYGTTIPQAAREEWKMPEKKNVKSDVRRDEKGVFTVPGFPGSDHPGKAKVRVVANGKNAVPTQNASEGAVGMTPAGTKATVPNSGVDKQVKGVRQFGDK